MNNKPTPLPSELASVMRALLAMTLAGCTATPPPAPAVPTVTDSVTSTAELDACRAMARFRSELLRAEIDRRPPALAGARKDFAEALARLRPYDGAFPQPALEPRALAYDGVLDAMDRIIQATQTGDHAARELGLAMFDDALARLRPPPTRRSR